MPDIKFKTVDVQMEIADFPMVPYSGRLFVIEKEVEQVGLIIVADTSKNKEMQTNEGWVVAIGDDVNFCEPGDVIYYARYSGAWCTINGRKFRVMNEEDILGRVV